MTRKLLAALLIFASLPAHAAPSSWALTCTAPCVASDGTVQPTGTVLAKVWADATFNPGAGLSIVPYTNQTIYSPNPPPPSVTIQAGALLNRFTNAELVAIAGNATFLPFLLHILADGSVTLTAASTTTALTALVTAGILTAPRATAIGTP